MAFRLKSNASRAMATTNMERVGRSSTDISKQASRLLRHCPNELEKGIDRDGWADLAGVVSYIAGNLGVDEDVVRDVLESSSNQRHEVDADRIRALYGHSFEHAIAYVPTVPPPTLYHVTPTRNLESVTSVGLKPGTRRYVHLSSTIAEATRRARHHQSKMATLAVDTRVARAATGLDFFSGGSGVWLSGYIPPASISCVGVGKNSGHQT